MESIPLEAISGDMSLFNPRTMIAKWAMGDWGPHGNRFAEAEYLDSGFDYDDIRQ